MLVKIVAGLRRGRGLDSPHEPVHDQDATKARPERDLAFSGHFPQVSPERSGACAHRRIAWAPGKRDSHFPAFPYGIAQGLLNFERPVPFEILKTRHLVVWS